METHFFTSIRYGNERSYKIPLLTQNQFIVKKFSLLLTMLTILFILSSCGGSPYKKRKGCHGKGSWYGKRNLSLQDQEHKQQNQTMYAWEVKSTENKN